LAPMFQASRKAKQTATAKMYVYCGRAAIAASGTCRFEWLCLLLIWLLRLDREYHGYRSVKSLYAISLSA
jgi:hypothetical protein